MSPDSPCINVGTGVDGLRVDYDGDLRTGTWLDIGVDEYPMEHFFYVPGVLKRYTP